MWEPILTLRHKFEIKVPEKFGKDQSHLCVSQAIKCKLRISQLFISRHLLLSNAVPRTK